jgi:hypothetical protein
VFLAKSWSESIAYLHEDVKQELNHLFRWRFEDISHQLHQNILSMIQKEVDDKDFILGYLALLKLLRIYLSL